MKRYTALEQVHLKGNPKKASEPGAQQKFEAEQLLGALDGRDYVVVLDERGTQITSFDLARILATAGTLARACYTVFVISERDPQKF